MKFDYHGVGTRAADKARAAPHPQVEAGNALVAGVVHTGVLRGAAHHAVPHCTSRTRAAPGTLLIIVTFYTRIEGKLSFPRR